MLPIQRTQVVTASMPNTALNHAKQVSTGFTGLMLGVDECLRASVLRVFHEAHNAKFTEDKKRFVNEALKNNAESDVDLAARLGVTKSAISNWRKTHNIRADKFDLLVALSDSHTAWPSPRDRYNHAVMAACTYCRNEIEDQPIKMTLEQLECIRSVVGSAIWSEAVLRRTRDDLAMREEADRICRRLREVGVQLEVRTLEQIDAVVFNWLIPYLRCVYVLHGEAAGAVGRSLGGPV